ncbi:MAG: tRNA pseudouridine(55) synthase TruB [Nitrospira sp.]|jgi:tRNA pseudouridine55 synthase|nr:tRNA pseudouridine(55) synthase TruB [Nitrospira sp.]MBP6607231.1 tRNA pseudouridine(55) synthase TruB [Nitrospira sp.]HQY57386.1 tRNA pseudouridine(55) synthase TruB [Nitrospira sp.]HRA97996.1 tRNA pseudouridine(55) synthase TruB [Nitrospira sp.]
MTMIVSTEPRTTTVLQDGVLNVRKEAGWTSHDVVARIRGKLRGMKLGHAGTLDPDATGVLPLLVGRGTRIAEYLLAWDKTYLAGLRLGETTDTQDATGTVLTRSPVESLTDARIREVVAGFEGRIQQLPPMYSAVKVGGVPLYKSARAGREVSRQAREVTVFRLDIVDIQIPNVTLRVACSKGTYIRTLCADIGEKLGVGGHMATLVRERVGPLTVDQALTVDEVESRLEQGALAASMLTLDEALVGLPVCTVGAGTAGRVLHGMPVPCSEVLAWHGLPSRLVEGEARPIRIKDDAGRLLAIGTMPIGMDTQAPGVSGQPIAVSKVLVTEALQGGSIANSIEE